MEHINKRKPRGNLKENGKYKQKGNLEEIPKGKTITHLLLPGCLVLHAPPTIDCLEIQNTKNQEMRNTKDKK